MLDKTKFEVSFNGRTHLASNFSISCTLFALFALAALLSGIYTAILGYMLMPVAILLTSASMFFFYSQLKEIIDAQLLKAFPIQSGNLLEHSVEHE